MPIKLLFCILLPIQTFATDLVPESDSSQFNNIVFTACTNDFESYQREIEQIVKDVYHNHDNEMKDRYTWLGVLFTLAVAVFGIGAPYIQNKHAEEKLKKQEDEITELVNKVEKFAMQAKTSEKAAKSAAKSMQLISQALSARDLGEQDSLLSEAIESNPSNAVAYNNRAFLYNEKREYEKAIADCNVAIFLDSQYIYPYKNRARAFLYLGRFEEAIKDCNKAISLRSNFGEAYYLRGRAYYEMGNKDQFYDDIKQAWEYGF